MKKLSDLSSFPPKKLHGLGSDAREKDRHLEALQYLDHAIVGYQKEENYVGIIGALGDRGLTWKHYFLLTEDKVYAVLAKKDAEARLEIVKEKGLDDRLSQAYFLLGEAEMLFEDYSKAIEHYQKALKFYKGSLSEKGDYRYHLGEALYRNNQKEKGKNTMIKGLEEIKSGASEVSDFLIHVWKSGCHMRLADLLRTDEPEEAIKHLKLAKEVIKSDKRLVIRKRQVEKLEKSF
jgi:tetratricopeptide (TPR) repeat protein